MYKLTSEVKIILKVIIMVKDHQLFKRLNTDHLSSSNYLRLDQHKFINRSFKKILKTTLSLIKTSKNRCRTM